MSALLRNRLRCAAADYSDHAIKFDGKGMRSYRAEDLARKKTTHFPNAAGAEKLNAMFPEAEKTHTARRASVKALQWTGALGVLCYRRI